MGERFIGGLVADEVGGGGGEGGDCLASTAAKGLSVLLLFSSSWQLASSLPPSQPAAAPCDFLIIEQGRGLELYTFVHFHFCSCASNMSNRYLWMKSYNSKVKPVGVGNVYLIIDCVQLFLENTLRKQSFWIWKDEWKKNLVLIFEKVTNVLGEISSHTFLSNIS